MGGKVIAIVNMKGGVGKTTLSVALSESLGVMAKKHVLVIDLDAQASCTFALIGKAGLQDARKNYKHSYQLFRTFLLSIGETLPVPEDTPGGPVYDESWIARVTRRQKITQPAPGPIRDLLVPKASGLVNPKPSLSLLPAIPELQVLEREIMFKLGQHASSSENPDVRIARFFKSHLDWSRANFDVVIIDCPPGISAFTAAAIRDADIVLAPVMPDYLSLLGLEVFAQSVLRPLGQSLGRNTPAYAVINRVMATPSHRQAKEDIKRLCSGMNDVLSLFPQEIEQSPDLQSASDGADMNVDIRRKYGNAIGTLEDVVRNTLDLCEGRR